MKISIKTLTATAVLASAHVSAGAQQASPQQRWTDRTLSADERAAAMVDAMTLEEQISLLRVKSGASLLSLGIELPPSLPEIMRQPKPDGAIGSAGFVAGIPRVGFPALQESDASLGVADIGFLRPGDHATALPSTLALAATFDEGLAREAGHLVGAEAHAKGFNVQLAGGVNIAREPRNGRNFEYFGEDPLLSGLLAGSQIAGIQDRNVVSTIKHFAINSQETGRLVHDALIGDAALRESDLLAFEIAIKRGQPGAVMCAYNKINGAYACENKYLLSDVLKGDWAYPGWVMSDWGAVHSFKPSIDAGLDQQSPQGTDTDFFSAIPAAVAKEEMPRAKVRDMAYRIVRALFAAGTIDNPAVPGGAIDESAHAAIAQRIAEAGVVLLKNDGMLPLASTARTIAIIGGHADKGVLSGGGSSQVTPYGGLFRDTRGKSGLAALTSPVYGLSSPLKALQQLRPDAKIVFDSGDDPVRAADVARHADIALVFAVKPEIEGVDSAGLQLPDNQDALIEAVATANRRTAVILETGNPVVMPWLGKVGAVLEAWFPGQRGGEAVAAILTGAASPSGRLPMTFPASIEQLPRPEITGFDPAKQRPLSIGVTYQPFAIEYHEGSDVGYRWFENKAEKPLFPFGHGLSYTSFAYSRLRQVDGDTLKVTLRITNTGKRAGIETAQLYVAPPGRTHRLAGWARVELKPGETREVSITANPWLLMSFDETAGRWARPEGGYAYYVGKAAGEPELSGAARLSASAEDRRRD